MGLEGTARRWWLCCWMVVLAAGSTLSAAGAEDLCDPRLEPAAEAGLAYTMRPGPRCEGLYAQDVAGSTLTLASLTSVFEPYEPGAVDELTVAWESPFREAVRLRGRGLRPRLFYRMDVALPAAARSFRWPADVIAGLDIAPWELGVAGWVRSEIGGVGRQVYLPLRVGPAAGGQPAAGAGVRVTLMPAEELDEVYVELAPVVDGHVGETLRQEALGYGFYPAGRPTRFTLDEMAEAGVYRLRVGAEIGSGGSTSLDLWFYWAG